MYPSQAGPGQDLVANDADVLVDTAVPDHAENILDTVIPNILEETDIAAQIHDMVIQERFEILLPKMLAQFFPGFQGKAKGPGNVRGDLPIQHQADHFTFIH